MKQGLALFDFDGTITRKDSLLEFIKFSSGTMVFFIVMALFAPIIFYYVFIKKNGETAKQRMLSFLYKGKSEKELMQLGLSFAENIIPTMLFPKAMAEIQKHLREGRKVIVISASLDIWLKPWADSLGIELICTKLQFGHGKFTGRFATANCNGVEKVNRIKAKLNLKDYMPIYAYGNSSGDKPMLALADFPHYRYFK